MLISILFKLKALLFFSLLLSPFVWLVEKLTVWQLDNGTYAALVLGAIAIDHFLGSIYHAFWVKDFSLKKNVLGLLLKLVTVVSVGYLFEGLNYLMEDTPLLKNYTIMTLRIMVFLYPAGSAFGNSYIMTNKQFPPIGFMEWIKKFSVNDFKNK